MKLKYFSFLLIVLGMAADALANIKIQNIRGASHFEITDEGANIYGGLAGECDPEKTDGQRVCNSCLNEPTADEDIRTWTCNRRRVYDNLWLVIQFEADADLEAEADILVEASSESNAADGQLSKRRLGPGGQAEYNLTWSQVCGNISCDGTGSVNLYIGVDANKNSSLDNDEKNTLNIVYHDPTSESSTPGSILCHTDDEDNDGDADGDAGICSFAIERGDGKVFLDQVQIKGKFPNYSPAPFYKVRVLYVNNTRTRKGYTHINYNTPNYEDISLLAEGGDDNDNTNLLADSTITGLTNEHIYAFKVAMIDKAQNLAFLTADAEIEHTTDENGAGPLCPQPDASDYTLNDAAACPYLARPEPVHGFLVDEKNCFIATAAWGSSQHWQLQVLRMFRDQVLAQHALGRAFIKWYYQYGPRWATWLNQHPLFKPLVRIVLWPIVGAAWLSLQWMGG